MEEEFIIDESSPKKILLTCLALIIIMAAGFWGFHYYSNQDFIKTKEVILELGAPVPTDINLYLKGKNLTDYTLDVSNIHVNEEGNTDQVGEYSYKITNGSNIKRGKVIVQDTTPPEVQVQDLTVGLNEEFMVDDFIIKCDDLSETCHVSYANKKDAELNEKEGTYEFNIIIQDKYENSVTKKVQLTVKKGAYLNSVKAEDLEVVKIYPKDDSWDGTFTDKFIKGLTDHDEELDDRILTLTNIDYSEKYDQEIINKSILFAYNQYDFVIGLIVKLEFADNSIIYVKGVE